MPDPVGFRARALARLNGQDESGDLKRLLSVRKAAENAVRNGQRRKALTPWKWRAVTERFGQECVYCGKQAKKLQKDHWLPVRLGGTLEAHNVVPACQKCNVRKRDTEPLEWMVGLEHGLVRYVEVVEYLEGQRR